MSSSSTFSSPQRKLVRHAISMPSDPHVTVTTTKKYIRSNSMNAGKQNDAAHEDSHRMDRLQNDDPHKSSILDQGSTTSDDVGIHDTDREQSISLVVYDKQLLSVPLKVTSKVTAKDIIRILPSLITDIQRHEFEFYHIVLVVTVYDSYKRTNVHCIRTINNDEQLIPCQNNLVNKLAEKYQVLEVQRLKSSCRWYYKDSRSAPLQFSEGGDMVGEDDSDDEEEISHSDLAYLKNAERKGYLLKRSGKDINLWRKWYCILTDQLYCINITPSGSRAVCIRLSGVVRYKDNLTSPDQIQSIVIHSPRNTHFFRAFHLVEQKKWINELNARIVHGFENDCLSMAEVIIADEEVCRSRRVQKSIHDLLDSDDLYQAIMKDRRYLPSRRFQHHHGKSANTHGSHTTTPNITPVKTSQQNNNEEHVINSPNHGVHQITNKIRLIHPLDRSRKTPALHRLHCYEPRFSQIIGFLADVGEYKEIFRLDISITSLQQRQVALRTFMKYLQPQILLYHYLNNNNDSQSGDLQNEHSENGIVVSAGVVYNGNSKDNSSSKPPFIRRGSMLEHEDQGMHGKGASVLTASNSGIFAGINSNAKKVDFLLTNNSTQSYNSKTFNANMLWGVQYTTFMKVFNELFPNDDDNSSNCDAVSSNSSAGSVPNSPTFQKVFSSSSSSSRPNQKPATTAKPTAAAEDAKNSSSSIFWPFFSFASTTPATTSSQPSASQNANHKSSSLASQSTDNSTALTDDMLMYSAQPPRAELFDAVVDELIALHTKNNQIISSSNSPMRTNIDKGENAIEDKLSDLTIRNK